MRALTAILVICLACHGCGMFRGHNDGGETAVAEAPKGPQDGGGAVVEEEEEEARPQQPFVATQEQAKAITDLVAKMTDETTRDADRMAALDALVKIGPPAADAVLKLLLDQKRAERYMPHVNYFFGACAKEGGNEYLLWVLTSKRAEERKAAHMVLMVLMLAEVPFNENAGSADRAAAVEKWEKVLAGERGGAR